MQTLQTFDEAAEPALIAAADATLASPLAGQAAQPVAQPPTPATIDTAVVAPVATASLAATTLSAPAQASPLGTLAPSTPATLPMLGALLLVVGLILVLGKLVRKIQSSRSLQGAVLQVKGGVQVGGKERVVWMQAGDTHLLLGVSPGRVQTLHVFDVAPDFATPAANEMQVTSAPDSAAISTPATRDFSDRLKALLAHAKAKGLDIETAAAETGNTVESVRPAAARPAEVARAAVTKPQFSFRA